MKYEEAIKLCEGIISDLEELPERTRRWREDTYGYVEDVQNWMEEHKHCTEKQVKRLEEIKEEILQRIEEE